MTSQPLPQRASPVDIHRTRRIVIRSSQHSLLVKWVLPPHLFQERARFYGTDGYSSIPVLTDPRRPKGETVRELEIAMVSWPHNRTALRHNIQQYLRIYVALEGVTPLMSILGDNNRLVHTLERHGFPNIETLLAVRSPYAFSTIPDFGPGRMSQLTQSCADNLRRVQQILAGREPPPWLAESDAWQVVKQTRRNRSLRPTPLRNVGGPPPYAPSGGDAGEAAETLAAAARSYVKSLPRGTEGEVSEVDMVVAATQELLETMGRSRESGTGLGKELGF